MKCSKCNYINPSEAEFCQSCSHKLACDAIGESQKDDKITSALRVFLRWVANLAYALIFPLTLGMLDPLLGVVSWLGAMIALLINRIAKKKGHCVNGKIGLAINVISWSVLFTVGIFLNLDAPPIENEYTIEDLRSAGPENNYSFHLLESLSLNKKTDIHDVIGMTLEDVNSIEALDIFGSKTSLSNIRNILSSNEEVIERAWESALRGKKAINILSEFDEIADLTVPSLDVGLDYLSSLKHLVQLYSSYAMLRCKKGNSNEGVIELIQIDRVFRKLSVNSRSIIIRLVCIAGMSMDIQAANYIANHPNTSVEVVKQLEAHFVPLTEQISMQNVLIAESIIFKKEMENVRNEFSDSMEGSLKKRRYLKINSSMRFHRNFMNEMLKHDNINTYVNDAELTVWPWNNPELLRVSFKDNGKISPYYWYYNPFGYSLLQILVPALEKIDSLHLKLKIQDDLLQIVIGLRLGREIDLSARAYGDEYVIDLNEEMIYSPGVDGEAFTDDDIKLYINPVVLGLK